MNTRKDTALIGQFRSFDVFEIIYGKAVRTVSKRERKFIEGLTARAIEIRMICPTLRGTNPAKIT